MFYESIILLLKKFQMGFFVQLLFSQKEKNNFIITVSMDISQEVITHLQVLRNYMIMWHELKKSDLIFVLCSYDTRVAERAAELYHAWYADTILVSWWLGRGTSLNEKFTHTSESEVFAKSHVVP